MSDDLVKRLRRASVQNLPLNDYFAQAADRIEELEKRINAAYLKMDVLEDEIDKYRKVLNQVSNWADELGIYADDGHELHPVLKKVKEVLR